MGTASSMGSSFHDRALFHARLGESSSPLKGDIRDRVALHPGALHLRAWTAANAATQSHQVDNPITFFLAPVKLLLLTIYHFPFNNNSKVLYILCSKLLEGTR